MGFTFDQANLPSLEMYTSAKLCTEELVSTINNSSEMKLFKCSSIIIDINKYEQISDIFNQ